ncbi:MAG TPA: ABC transporter permease [Bdellovibrionales bacterium]|nr:ABC transporter permease [Bdellovibrionales bacterium]
MIGKILGLGLIALFVVAIGLDLGDFEIPVVLWAIILAWSLTATAYAVIRANMFVYVGKRLLEAVFVIWVIATLTFGLLRFLPGGPFDAEKALPPDIKANIEAKYGLHDPIMTQYGKYLVKTVQGDFGESYKYLGRNVTDIILESFPASFQLGIYSLLLAFIIGIPIGVFAASKHNTLTDNALMITAISGVALPSFIVGPILVMIFSFGIPFSSMYGLLPPALWESPIYYILPVITLGLRPAAIIARMTRSSMLDVIQSDFIRTAKAKGVAHRVVLFKHVLKNSLIPVLTISGPLVAGILSGSFIVEVVFGIPGIGKHLIQSVTNRDYPLVLGLTLVFSAMLVIANLIVDLLYTVVDPRIKLQ